MNEEDTQAHILVSDELNVENKIVSETIEYNILFSDMFNDKISVAKLIKERFKIRDDILRKKKCLDWPK